MTNFSLQEHEGREIWVLTSPPKTAPKEIPKAPKECRQLYRTILSYLDRVFERARAGEDLLLGEGVALVMQVLEGPWTRDHWLETVQENRNSTEAGNFLTYHHTNVAIYSLCLSMTLGCSAKDQARLGLTALYHDLGKLWVPDEILFKKDRLTERDWEVLRHYPYETYRLLKAYGPGYEVMAECALQVNERLDGLGYPQGLKGDAIHPFALVIGLADVYEALTSNRPFRERWLHYHAVKEILHTGKSSFPRHLLKALLQTFSVFPLHSYVKLNSGVIGKIIEVREDLPMRPKVEVVRQTGNGHAGIPLVIDLAAQPFLYISEPLAEKEFTGG